MWEAAVLTTNSSDTGQDSIFIEHAISGVTAEGVPATGAPDCYTVRTREWRLTYYPALGTGELYSLAEDPKELVNRWSDAKLDSVRAQMKDRLPARMAAAHDPLPVRENRY